MTESSKEVQINFKGKCRACGQKMKVVCPWEKGKPFLVACKRCGLRQQIYPYHEELDFPRLGGGKGFSLVELLIVVAIVGILVAIAYVCYQPFFGKINELRGLWPH